jgi:hypothetical protein
LWPAPPKPECPGRNTSPENINIFNHFSRTTAKRKGIQTEDTIEQKNKGSE